MLKEKDILRAIVFAPKEKELKQEYIAQLIGKERTIYSKKERGLIPMTLKELEKITDILSIDASTLLKRGPEDGGESYLSREVKKTDYHRKKKTA